MASVCPRRLQKALAARLYASAGSAILYECSTGSSKRLNAHGLAAGEEKRLKPNIVHWTGLRWAAQALRRADVGAIGLGL